MTAISRLLKSCATPHQLTQCLDFLCLQQRCLGPLATRNFFPELTVRSLKVSRSLRHQSLQFGGGAALRLKVRTSLILSPSGALCGKDRGLKRDGLQRALEKATLRRRMTNSRLNAANLPPSLGLVSTTKG